MASDCQAISNAIPVSDSSPPLKSPNLETTALTEPNVTDTHENAVSSPSTIRNSTYSQPIVPSVSLFLTNPNIRIWLQRTNSLSL